MLRNELANIDLTKGFYVRYLETVYPIQIFLKLCSLTKLSALVNSYWLLLHYITS